MAAFARYGFGHIGSFVEESFFYSSTLSTLEIEQRHIWAGGGVDSSPYSFLISL